MKSLTFSLYSSKNTVFTTQEIALITKETNLDRLKSRLNYFVKKGILKNIRKGLYVKSTGYEIFEAANKIYTPSYISLETALQISGITFQNYDKTIFAVSYQTRDINLDGYIISFKKIKEEILTNSEGLNNDKGFWIASPERAFLDKIYLSKNFFFDNLGQIDWKRAKKILKIYNNKTMERRFNSYVKDFFSQANLN